MLSLLFLFAASSNYSQVNQEWVRTYNGPGNDEDGVSAIAVDLAGNVYVTGYSRMGNTWGTSDYATVKYNSSGAEQWVQRYNGTGNDDDIAKSIAVDNSGNVYVTGYSYGIGSGIDIVTIKYNSSGVQQWIHRYNGPGNGPDNPNSIVVDQSGNVYITGYVYVTSINDDCVTIKYNPSGSIDWTSYYSDSTGYSREKGAVVAVDNSGNVYVAGDGPGGHVSHYLAIKYNSAGAQIWANKDMNTISQAKSMVIDETGNIYLTGSNGVIKYNTSGELQWSVPDINGNTIAVDASGNVYCAGFVGLGDLSDYHTVKLNPSGALTWEKTYDGPANRDDKANSIIIDNLGNVYVTGIADMNSQLKSFGTIKYNSNGVQQWVQRYPISSLNYVPVHIKSSNPQNIFIGGSSSGNYVAIKYSQNFTGIEPVSNQISSAYSLSQNYPNPFNPSTKIRFDIIESGLSSIVIYDALGRELSPVVNEQLAAGTYEVQWDASGYPSGIYYYRLTSGGYSETKKMILVK